MCVQHLHTTLQSGMYTYLCFPPSTYFFFHFVQPQTTLLLLLHPSIFSTFHTEKRPHWRHTESDVAENTKPPWDGWLGCWWNDEGRDDWVIKMGLRMDHEKIKLFVKWKKFSLYAHRISYLPILNFWYLSLTY